MIKPIYLDYNGTTPHAPEVIEAMRPFLETEFGNPSSSHWYGIGPKQAVEKARRQVAGLLGCLADEVIFTSGGTESNNHAIKSMADMRDRLEQGLSSTLEDVRFNGHRHQRLPNTSSVSFRGLEANRILEEIGLEVAASAGAACHSDQVIISHVLEAMGLAEAWAKGTVRFTTGRMTTAEEIDRALEVIVAAVKKLRG